MLLSMSHLKKKRKLHSAERRSFERTTWQVVYPTLNSAQRISEFRAKSLSAIWCGVTLSVRWLRHVVSEMSPAFLNARRGEMW